MRARMFHNTPDESTSTDSGSTTSTPDTTTTDDPGRTDTDTLPKKKAE